MPGGVHDGVDPCGLLKHQQFTYICRSSSPTIIQSECIECVCKQSTCTVLVPVLQVCHTRNIWEYGPIAVLPVPGTVSYNLYLPVVQ